MADRFESEQEAAEWMRELARVPLEIGPLPDVHQLWWKAELLKRWDARRTAVAPIDRAEPVQVWIGLAGAFALLVSLLRSVDTSPAIVVAAVASFVVMVMFAVFAARELAS
jgi:hypothetical protein